MTSSFKIVANHRLSPANTYPHYNSTLSKLMHNEDVIQFTQYLQRLFIGTNKEISDTIEELCIFGIIQRHHQALIDLVLFLKPKAHLNVIELLVNHQIIADRSDPLIGESLEQSFLQHPDEFIEIVTAIIHQGIIQRRDDFLVQKIERHIIKYADECIQEPIIYKKFINVMINQGLITKQDDQLLTVILIQLESGMNTTQTPVKINISSEHFMSYVDILINLLNHQILTNASKPICSDQIIAKQTKWLLFSKKLIIQGSRISIVELLQQAQALDSSEWIDDLRKSILHNNLQVDSALTELYNSPYLVSRSEPDVHEPNNKSLLYDFAHSRVCNTFNALVDELGLPIGYITQLIVINNKLQFPEGHLHKIIKQGHELLALIKKTNQSAQTNQQVDMAQLEHYKLRLLAILQLISIELCKEFVYNQCQRGFMPMLVSGVEKVSCLEPFEISSFHKLINKLKALKVQLPVGIFFNILDFYNSFKDFDIPIHMFEDCILKIDPALNSQAKLKQIIHNLAQVIIATIARNLNIDLSLHYNQTEEVLKHWNSAGLGAVVAASKRWQPLESSLFRIALRTSLEGNFELLLNTGAQSTEFCSTYSYEEKQIVHYIQAYNTNFRTEAQALGVNLDAWLNPARVKPIYLNSSGKYRNWQVVLLDFCEAYQRFDNWFNSSDLHDDEALKNQYLRANKSLGGYNHLLHSAQVRPDFKPGLLNQDQNLSKLLKFLEHLLTLEINEQDNRDLIADMINIIQEIKNYDLKAASKQERPLRMRLWKRIVSEDAFIANQVGSCTTLDNNAAAIFEYLLDLGTIYLVIDDPIANKAKGYVRFFLGQSHFNKANIIIDSADGVANSGLFEPTSEAVQYIKSFAQTCNIRKQNVEIIGNLKKKAGNALTSRYKHHTNITIPKFDQETEY